MARFTHDLLDLEPAAREWGIVGAGLLPADRRMHDVLSAQDRLYTLVEHDGTEETVSVIGTMTGLVHSADDSAALLQIIDRPLIRIVSLTVTENGYCLNPATKQLDFDSSDDCRGPGAARSAAQRGCNHRRSAAAADGRGSTRVHCAQLRQHPAQRQRAASGGTGVRRSARCELGRLDRMQRSISEHDGRPHHPGDAAPRRSPIWRRATASTTAGRCSAKRSGSG